jgi:hypothetical protein
MDRSIMISTIEDLMQMAKTKKQNADDGERARHWAVVYTKLEDAVAHLKTYLSEESVE